MTPQSVVDPPSVAADRLASGAGRVGETQTVSASKVRGLRTSGVRLW